MAGQYVPNFTSVSQLEAHRKCPQAWAYKQVRGLSRPALGTAVERDLGTWWHLLRAVHSFNRGLKLGSLKWAPEKLGGIRGYEIPVGKEQIPLKAVFELMAQWWKRLTADDRQAWLDHLGETPMARIKYLHQGWVEAWRDDLENEEPLAVEFKWRSILTTGADGFAMGGYVDEIYRDRARNLVVVRDHKTGGNIQGRTSVDDLLESQLQVYAWGCAETVKGWGLTLSAVGYDRVRVTKPREPGLTQTGALSKAVTDYDLRTYLAWAGEGISWGEEGAFYASGAKKGKPKFGVYEPEQSVIDKLSTPEAKSKWFDRTLQPLNKNIVGAHIYAARDTAAATLATQEQMASRGSTARNFGRNCQWCDFQKLCLSEVIGGNLPDPLTSEDLLEYGLTNSITRR